MNKFSLAFTLIFLFSSCAPATTVVPQTKSPIATAIPTSTKTLTPLPTSTSTLTSTPTPIPQPITSANIDKISEDFQIGVGEIIDISWLPNGNIALTHSTGVSIYDSKTLKLIETVRPISKVSLIDSVISHNGKYVASLVDSQTIQVWDINTGEIIYKIETNCQETLAQTNRIAFSHDDTKLFACDEKGVSFWELSDLKKTVFFETEYGFSRIIINSDDSYMAVDGSFGSYYGDIVVLNMTTGKTTRTFPKAPNDSSAMQFSHNGTMLAISDDTDVVIYEMSSDKVLNTINNNDPVISVEFDNDDKTIAIGSHYYAGTKFVDVSTGEFISTLENVAARMIKYSPDGMRLAIGWNDVSVWSTTDNINYKQVGKTEIFSSYNQVVIDPNSKYIAVGGNGAFVALWDLEKKVALDYVFAYGGNFTFNPTGTSLITRAWNENNWWGSIQSWNLQTKKSSQFDNIIEKVAYTSMRPLFCPTDNCIAVGYEQQQIKFWDTSSYKLMFTVEHSGLSDYEFSPNGAFFASSGRNSVYFWDLKTQQPIRKLYAGGQISDISFSPDNNLMAWAANDGVVISETDSGQITNEIKEIKNAYKVIFNPNGNIIGALGYDANNNLSLFIWDISNNKLLYKIPDETTNPGFTFLFSPDGSLLVTVLSEHIQFWNAVSGELIKTLDWSKTFAFTPDGRKFAAITADGTVKILQVLP